MSSRLLKVLAVIFWSTMLTAFPECEATAVIFWSRILVAFVKCVIHVFFMQSHDKKTAHP